ncbi:MAG: hypothetical protein BroJett040_06810 [Oligoflexia bacterium]|nr:MAG: hypothetical protein BroJett040_06810 [Oligoflexia bacterium]
MKNLKMILSIFILGFVSSFAQASQLLTSGAGPIPLPGTAAISESDLAGTVIRDELIPFRIMSPAGALLFQGVLQDRVVKSSADGELHFYRRIRDTKAGLNGIIRSVQIKSFATSPMVYVDWRPDGLGDVAPKTAQRSALPGTVIQFNFLPAILVGGKESKFFYMKTRASNFAVTGLTRIELTTGHAAILRTAEPR